MSAGLIKATQQCDSSHLPALRNETYLHTCIEIFNEEEEVGAILSILMQ